MVDKISLPVVIPDRLLISPGVWNDNEYTAKEIGEGFARTEWANKEKISLWLNHDDRNTSAFVGYVKNPVLASNGRVFGDLEIWDEKLAVTLTQAMAKFGVSAKIKGEENKEGKMLNFSFENFSVVTIPACSDAYINLSKKEDNEKLTSKYLISDKDIDDMLGDEVPELKEDNAYNIERRLEKNMAEEKKIDEVKDVELSNKIDALTEKFDKLVTLLTKKELAEEVKEEEVKEEVEEDESTIDPEGAVLLPKEEAVEEVVVENESELTAVKKELSEIKALLDKPKSKTVRNLSSNTVENAMYDENQFCNLLEAVDSPMKFA